MTTDTTKHGETTDFESQTTESKTIAALKAAQTPADAATIFRKVFKRATMPVDSAPINAANEIYAAMD